MLLGDLGLLDPVQGTRGLHDDEDVLVLALEAAQHHGVAPPQLRLAGVQGQHLLASVPELGQLDGGEAVAVTARTSSPTPDMEATTEKIAFFKLVVEKL